MPDDWKEWETCTNNNLYVCLGLNEEGGDYKDEEIERAYKERYEFFQRQSYSKNSPRWGGKFDFALTNLQKAKRVLTNKEEKKKYDQKLKEEQYKEKVNEFVEVVIKPVVEKDKLITSEEEKNIVLSGRRLGLTDAECDVKYHVISPPPVSH